MTEIDWSAFSWEAFAGLVTGLLAVAGAVVIGLRQVEIARRQTELQALAIKRDLFEKRYAVYLAVRDYLGTIVWERRAPTDAEGRAFLQAIDPARFLFQPPAHDRLLRAFAAAQALQAGDLGSATASKLYQDLVSTLAGLEEILGEELRLS